MSNRVMTSAEEMRLHPPTSPLLFTVVRRDLGWWSGKQNKWHNIEDEVALIRNGTDDEPIWLSNVGKSYEVVQNEELFRYFGNVIVNVEVHHPLDDDGFKGVREWREGAHVHDEVSFGGRYCYRTYKFPALNVQIGERQVDFRIFVANGFGGSAVQLLSGAYEVVCTNGMIVGFADRTVRKHTSGISIPDLGRWVEDSIEKFIHAGEKWRTWDQTSTTDERVRGFLERDKSISARLAERLYARWEIEKVERGATAWALYNALTHYATHNQVSPLRDTGNDHAAKTVMDRHRQVNRWVNGKAWADFIGPTLVGSP